MIHSIGHSTHALDTLVGLLAAHEVTVLADIRTVPRSRRWPHLAGDRLAETLPDHGVRYLHLAALGGWRRAAADSPNGAWRNASFRGYADYALTPAFEAGLDELKALAQESRTAMMCSESLWWRCHRRLVADRLTVDGWEVVHIGSDGRLSRHRLADFAAVRADGTVVYPPT